MTLIVIALGTGAAFGWLAVQIVTAPEGVEDDTGFHYGREQ